MPKPNWTEQEKEKLLQLWLEGKTVGQIMELMPHRNRNSIIGKVHALKAKGAPIINRENPVKLNIQRSIAKVQESQTKVMEKNESHCADVECYNPKNKGSYCETHAAIYYRQPTKNEQKIAKKLSDNKNKHRNF